MIKLKDLRKGNKILDKKTGKVGIYTGIMKTSYPCFWVVQYPNEEGFHNVFDLDAELVKEENE